MATKWISPTWRMPEESNQSKFENYSLDFPGAVSQRISVTASDTILPDQSDPKMSISAWIYMDTSSSGISRTIFSSGKVSSGAVDYTFEVNNGYLFFKVRTTNVSPHYATITGGTTISLNTWYHASATWDGANLNLYLNSVVDATPVAATSFYATSNSSPMIGVREGGGYYSAWAGKLGQICYFDYALSETQINYLYNNNAGGSTPNPQNPMAISGNSPIAYYDLGGSSTGDAGASSPNTLTVPNSSVPSATVFEFNVPSGGVDRITLNQGITLTGNKTFSAWINLTTAQDAGGFLFFGEASTNYYLFIQGDYIYIRDSSGFSAAQYTPGFSLNTWYHICISGDGTNLIPYVNGSPISGTYVDREMQSENTIGSYSNSTFPYRGEMSNIQIWDTNLSSIDVTTLYNYGVPLLTGTQPQAANLKAWYKMNSDTSNWDGSNWEIGNSTANYSSALDFDGTNDYIDCGNDSSLNITSNLSVSVWFKTSNNGQMITKDSGVNGTRSFSFGITSGKINATVRDQDGSPLLGDTTQTDLTYNDGNWHHSAFIYEPSTSVKVYVDGNLVKTNTSSIVSKLTDNASTKLTIGSYQNGAFTEDFNGSLSNVSIWNAALTSAQVQTLYNNGTPETSISHSPISWWKLDNTTTGIQDSGSASNNGTNNGATQVSSLVSTLNGTSSGMTTANLVNSDLTRSIPYSSYSMYMTGSTDDTYFDLGTDIVVGTSGNTTYSWSIWVKPVDDGFTSQVVVFGDSGATDDGSLVLERSGGNFTALVEQTGTELESSAGAVINNAWTHIAIVVDSTASTKKMYINGQEDTAVGGTGAGPDGTIKNINSSNTSNQYTGYVSNWAFWTSALSDDNILSIYNSGVPNSLTSLSPAHWWSMSGDSYYNGSAWTCPDLIGSNNLTGVNDSGKELIGDGPGSTSNGVATGMNIPGNLQGNAPNSTANAFSVNMNFGDKTSDVPVVT